MPKSPPGRSSTLPPLARPRPRKSSVTQNARKPKHERTKSKEQARRLSIGERKAYSAEPQGPSSDGDRRWQGLIEAATSATEADSDRELTPIAQSPHVKRERTQPPFYPHLHSKPLEASPLQKNLTYTSDLPDPDPEREFPSVESSLDSGHNFHMHSSGLSNTNSDSSPIFRHPVEIYCASCRRPTILKESYACPDCICGICVDCVYLINGQNDRRSSCPRCQQSGKEYKQFSLEFVL
ncbi:hypothetical protein MMC14_007400 [Varicellaria rhodocarpa]|nr:hypothetical protein [Varicellaria rhodocarpa]